MSGNRPEVDTEEFIQARMERQIREQYELHGWSALTVANPLEILIMLEEADEEDEPQTTTYKARIV